MTSVLTYKREKRGRHDPEERPCGVRGRDWSDAVMRPGRGGSPGAGGGEEGTSLESLQKEHSPARFHIESLPSWRVNLCCFKSPSL